MYNYTRLFFVLTSILILLSGIVIICLVQIFNLELNTNSDGDNLLMFYNVSIPIAVFSLIVFRHQRFKQMNWVDIISGFFVAGFIYIVGIYVSEVSGGEWVVDEILFESKVGKRQIVNETYELGVFGHDGYRTICKEPFLFYFYKIEEIDISKIDLSKWGPVNKVIRGA